MAPQQLQNIIEAALSVAGKPLNILALEQLFVADATPPTRQEIHDALSVLQQKYSDGGCELVQVASGYRIQARQQYAEWLGRLWEEKPSRYSRALLETLSLIAYRQPITRGEIEHVRGVAVSSNIIRTLIEREWIRVIGRKEVPGRPSMYATTRQFLDYFNLKSLEQLPTLSEIQDLDALGAQASLRELADAAPNPANTENILELNLDEDPPND